MKIRLNVNGSISETEASGASTSFNSQWPHLRDVGATGQAIDEFPMTLDGYTFLAT
ncbi:MAG: hypothetical protein ACU85U_20640 [Gammaproteobacteria bacterium]|jgi:hypothetical protein